MQEKGSPKVLHEKERPRVQANRKQRRDYDEKKNRKKRKVTKLIREYRRIARQNETKMADKEKKRDKLREM